MQIHCEHAHTHALKIFWIVYVIHFHLCMFFCYSKRNSLLTGKTALQNWVLEWYDQWEHRGDSTPVPSGPKAPRLLQLQQ